MEKDFLTNCKVGDKIDIKGVSISGYFYLKDTEDTIIIEDDSVTRIIRAPKIVGSSGEVLCDTLDCWYYSNMDRKCEYKYSLPVVVSYCKEWGNCDEFNLNEKYLPNVVHLCDVCGSPDTKCVLCNILMADDALKVEGHDVCRMCAENDETIIDYDKYSNHEMVEDEWIEITPEIKVLYQKLKSRIELKIKSTV